MQSPLDLGLTFNDWIPLIWKGTLVGPPHVPLGESFSWLSQIGYMPMFVLWHFTPLKECQCPYWLYEIWFQIHLLWAYLKAKASTPFTTWLHAFIVFITWVVTIGVGNKPIWWLNVLYGFHHFHSKWNRGANETFID